MEAFISTTAAVDTERTTTTTLTDTDPTKVSVATTIDTPVEVTRPTTQPPTRKREDADRGDTTKVDGVTKVGALTDEVAIGVTPKKSTTRLKQINIRKIVQGMQK